MKTGRLFTGMILGMFVSLAYGQELAPDQNPNYMNAAQKYAAQANETNALQSTTIQDTYEAYDWREAKAEAKELRLQRRHEIRTLRYQRPYGYGGYYGYDYYRPYRWNYGYNYAPNFNYVNPLLGVGVGLGLYHLLH